MQVSFLSRFSPPPRLARFLRRTKGPNEVEEQVLSNYISPSCFVLENLPGCREGDESWPK